MTQSSDRQKELEQKRRHWGEHIRAWQDSGLSQIEYCRRNALSYHRFVYWRDKFAPKSPTTSVSIVEVPMSAVAAVSGRITRKAALKVCLGPDLGIDVLPGFDARTLQQIVIALRGIC